ncbi:MAG: helix-turn-helix transcriptional regulator [Deltaproteobacteria bacterium]|nr:helix-turn-helix transcriptional regulator [Deltaproteobacteria bacterium]
MIKTESEYRKAVVKVREERQRIEGEQFRLKQESVPDDLINLALDPLISFMLQLEEEIQFYERIKRGVFPSLNNLGGIGNLLVALRINKGISQKDLAHRLGVKESQISRDEKNEYRGASIERVSEVLKALGAQVVSHVNTEVRDVSSLAEASA